MICQKYADLKPYSYYRTGGRCEFLYLPESIKDVCQALKDIYSMKLPYFILGGGSNSLVSDEFFFGAVISLHHMQAIEPQANHRLYAEAGAENSAVVQRALQLGWEGISWMYRLPGQIGGTVRMNARCYGGEISAYVDKVWAVTPEGELCIHSKPQPMFTGYKDTIFMRNRHLIAAVEIQLKPGSTECILEKMNFCEQDRVNKGQFLHPSCGCVFKNDYSVGIPSGKLLESAGAKTLSTKNLAINPHHANFLFNKTGQASSQEILDMSFEMQELVYQNCGVWLEYEMEVLGTLDAARQRRLIEKRPRIERIPNKP